MDLTTAKVFLDLAVSKSQNRGQQRRLVLTVIELLAIDLAHTYRNAGQTKESAKAIIMEAVSERIDALFSC